MKVVKRLQSLAFQYGAGLRKLTNDDELVKQLIVDWRGAPINAAELAMLAYAEKLTIRPWEMVEADVQKLREVGFSDGAILDINQVTGYYAEANRLVDGLGVELEEVNQENT